jgi:hypothetical protein
LCSFSFQTDAKTDIVEDIERSLSAISTKSLLRDVFPTYEGLLLWRAIAVSNIMKGSTAKVLVDVANYFKFSEDPERRVDKIMQCLLRLDVNRQADISMLQFIRNRKQSNLLVSETALASTRSPSMQTVLNALRNFRSLDSRLPQLSPAHIFSVLQASIADFSNCSLTMMLQELCLLLVRVEEGKSEEFFRTLTNSVKSRALTLPTVYNFFAASEVSTLYDSSKALNSSQLKILWKDSEVLCLLCDLVTLKAADLPPFEVKKTINLLQTASNEFISLSAEAELLSIIKFYFAHLVACCQQGTRTSFEGIDLPSLSFHGNATVEELLASAREAVKPDFHEVENQAALVEGGEITDSSKVPFARVSESVVIQPAADISRQLSFRGQSLASPASITNQEAATSYLMCLHILIAFHQSFEDIRDQCLQGYNFEYIHRESTKLLANLQAFLPTIPNYTLPPWLVSAESVVSILTIMYAECQKIIAACDTEIFRSSVTGAMSPIALAYGGLQDSFLPTTVGNSGYGSTSDDPEREDPLAKALGEYLLSKTLVLLSNNQTVVQGSSVNKETVDPSINQGTYLNVQNSKRVSKDGLIYRANLLYLLREAIRKDNWLASEAEKNQRKSMTAEAANAAAASLTPAQTKAARRSSVNYHQSANVPTRRVSVSMSAAPAVSAKAPVNDASKSLLNLDSSVQTIVEQWYSTVQYPDIWDGSAEFRTAYDELRNRLLFETLIKFATVGEQYNPCKVLQLCYDTAIGYTRPINVNNVISRLDVHTDLLAIEKTNSLWALEVISKAYVNSMVQASAASLSGGAVAASKRGSSHIFNRKSSMNNRLLQPLADNQSESSEAVVTLYRKLSAAYEHVKCLSTAIRKGDSNESKFADLVTEITTAQPSVESGPVSAMEMLAKQLLVLSKFSSVSSEFLSLLSCIQNWSSWDESEWTNLEMNSHLTTKLSEFRGKIASSRRQYMLKHFMSFYSHEASDIYLNLADMLMETFGEEAENSWQERGEVIRAKLSSCFHLEKYFSDIFGSPDNTDHLGSEESRKTSTDCQLFHLQQILDAEPKCRSVMSNAQTLKRVKDKLCLDTWTENKQELRTIIQTHIDNDLWQVLNSSLLTVDAELTLQKVLEEIDIEIDIGTCKCRFEIANVLSQAVVRVSNLSLACISIFQQQQQQQQRAASQPHLHLSHTSTASLSNYTQELLQTVEWTLNMRLAILSEDWKMVDQLDDVFERNQKTITDYCPYGAEVLAICLCFSVGW